MRKEIIELNEPMIAEFMDLEYINYQQSNGDNGWWKKGTFKDGTSAYNSNFICIHNAGLKFHSDWNRLISVFKKIERQGCIVEVSICLANTCSITRASLKNPCRFVTQSNSLEEAAYDAVVQYINWYNLNK